MAKVYYIGDWAIMTGPVFAETPFNYAHKGLEIYNYGHWLKDALESNGAHQVTSVPTWDFYKLGPGEYEQVLADYDVLIFRLAFPSGYINSSFSWPILVDQFRIQASKKFSLQISRHRLTTTENTLQAATSFYRFLFQEVL